MEVDVWQPKASQFEGHPLILPVIIYFLFGYFVNIMDTRATSGIRMTCLGAFRGQEGILRPLFFDHNISTSKNALAKCISIR